MALEKELETYRQHLSEWTGSEGKYVLIKGDEIAGLFSSYDDALMEGYRRYELGSFLVKQISAFQQAQFVSRLHSPCPISPAK